MPIELITGTPGAGKTLYAVAKRLRPMIGQTIEVDGRKVSRRLCIGGVRDLLIEHEPIEVPQFDPAQADEWAALQRQPGEPARSDVPHLVTNWWLWCKPGDVIVIDECQRVFRPMASGRPVPRFIAMLETHRHYGVDFVIITQHPQLIHTNVRNLVGGHEHVRRIWGRGVTCVYQWDHCTHPDRTATAVTRVWRHDKDAYSLYKSAEVHTKQQRRIPWPVWLGLAALVMLGYALWRLWSGGGIAPVAAAAAAASAPQPAASAPKPAALKRLPEQQQLLSVEAMASDPYAGYAVHADGCIKVGTVQRCSFGLSTGGHRVATLSDRQLVASGYSITYVAMCAVVLRPMAGRERRVVCDSPAPMPVGVPAVAAARADPAASQSTL